MKREYLRKYLWLINLIRRSESLTFEQISRAWSESSINIDDTVLALRTFHNHRDDIHNLFGIRVACDRSTNRYYIEEADAPATRLKLWMLDQLTMAHLVKPDRELSNRIIMDSDHDECLFVSIIIEAMKCDVSISAELRDADTTRRLELLPYALRYHRGEWYVAAATPDSPQVRTYALDAFVCVSATENPFDYPEDFSPESYFRG